MFIKFILLPLRVAKKLIRKFQIEITELFSSTNLRIKNLENLYKKIGFCHERDYYIRKLNGCLETLSFPKYDENLGMYSEHLIIFTAISLSNLNVKKILEIGTHDGKSAAILSSLFPEAFITTIDLNDEDPLFANIYNRKSSLKEFINQRNKILKTRKNINFIQGNSLFLSFSENLKGQDLIWVDGAHGYPVVSCDITNCLRIMSNSGIIMCDDVWKKLNKSDQIYSSTASYETISAFTKVGILETEYLSKRIGKKYNGRYKSISFSKFVKGFKTSIN